MPEENPQNKDRRFTGRLLTAAAVLSALTAVSEAASFFYARAHLQEILREGSISVLGGKAFLTESAAQANPHLVTAAFCVLISAACAVGAHVLRNRERV